MVALSIMMGTILYAYKYTTSYEVSNNSFQNGNGGNSQGFFQQNNSNTSQDQFQKNDGGNQNRDPSNGDSKKNQKLDWRIFMDNNKNFLKKFLILTSIIWLALLVRIHGLPFTSGDYKIYHFVIIPLTYLFLSIPSLIVGRPLKDILLTYFNQSGEYTNLTYNAPSIYQWVPSKLFTDTTLVGYIGILFTFAVVLIIIYVSVRYIKVIKYENIIELSLIFAIVVPFLLPRMHERYFFMADIISL